MRVIVCTLFEKKYHLGVAVLVNSLVRAEFKGEIYAGFRGPLPSWAEGIATLRDASTWEISVTPAVRLVLARIETEAHFTNFKPQFLLNLLDRPDADAVFYCDPDVVVNTPWRFLADWLTCGIAVCDDVNSPMAENHPSRVGWRRFFRPRGMELRYRGPCYANGGVLGVMREHRRVLEAWVPMMAEVAAFLGGTGISNLDGDPALAGGYGFADCFSKTDQDVLNAAFEACPEIPVSFLGKQAMGFDAGAPLLPHATGSRKPWTRRFIREALAGRAPARVDKFFWEFADGPLHPFNAPTVRLTRARVKVAAALGRIIRRT